MILRFLQIRRKLLAQEKNKWQSSLQQCRFDLAGNTAAGAGYVYEMKIAECLTALDRIAAYPNTSRKKQELMKQRSLIAKVINNLAEKVTIRRGGFNVLYRVIRINFKCGHEKDEYTTLRHNMGMRCAGLWNLGRAWAYFHRCETGRCYHVRFKSADFKWEDWIHPHAANDSCSSICLNGVIPFTDYMIRGDLIGLLLAAHGFLTSANCLSPLYDISTKPHLRVAHANPA